MSETPRTATEEWKWRRREVIIRDDYTCQECGAKGGPEGDAELHAHHKTPVAEGGSDDPENLITLCKACHQSRHGYEVDTFVRAIDPGEKLRTGAIAERVGCSHSTAIQYLDRAAELGRMEPDKQRVNYLWEPPDE